MRSAGGERRWPDSRSVFRKPMALNGTRCRPLHEERNARISILANGTAEGPDTFVQTDQPITTKPLADGAGHTLAPLAARWAFTIVLSIRYRLSRELDASVSKIRFQMPRRDQRLKRLYAVV